MPYVLQKTDSPRRGFYVAVAGSPESYVRNLEHARQYPTQIAAAADACGNESAVPFNPLER